MTNINYQPPHSNQGSHSASDVQSPVPLFGKKGTVVLAIASVLGFLGVQVISLLLALLITFVIMPNKIKDIDNIIPLLSSDGTILSISLIFNLLAVILIVFFVIKSRKKQFTDYLQFRRFSLKNMLFGFGLWIAYLIASAVVLSLIDSQPMGFLDAYFLSAEPLWLLFLGVVLLAPIYEELLFRGLIWRAVFEQFLDERKGAIVASVLSGVLFAIIHFQYGFHEIGAIFVFALVLGFIRYRSGSILLPIMIHIANNGLSMLQYALIMNP
ncbi:type II CAAX endopeptidase family protein [Psychrobacter sp. HD31]|uniref:CPBP family intramembrane glutamic endopeptidase n=1 Tax=Psychrobacter sp. HD31 TaxID=3112003 RepID=UPI003DA3958A